jgi:UPF0755 protein
MENEKSIDLADISEEECPTPEKKEGKKRTALYVVLGVVAAIIITAVVIIASAVFDYKGTSRSGELCTVNIPQGSAVSTIAKLLEDAGAIDNALLFRVYSRLSGSESLYQYGTYEFKNDIGFEAIADLLITKGAVAQTVSVTIPEGTTLYDYTKNVNKKDVTVPGIATLLSRAGVCKTDDFFTALEKVDYTSRLLSTADKENTYYPLEGYLFADTYEFYFCGCTECDAENGKKKECSSKECAEKAIKRMLDRTEEIITDEMVKNAQKMGYSIHEMLTLASIIQLESGIDTEEMQNVSAVFHNRLNNPASFPMLGSSPTIYYDKSMNGDGRYDTQNKAKGLPPGPLCSSGAAAIKAAFMPTQNFGHTYFVTDSDGKFYYNSSAAGHSATIKQLQNAGKWIYEYY